MSPSAKTFTPKQGQYLAFIHLYTRPHRRPPAETDMQEYFSVSPPSVHQMVLSLERAGLIKRRPRTPRGSAELKLPPGSPVPFQTAVPAWVQQLSASGPHLERGELARAYPVRTTTLTLVELLDPYRFTRGVKVRGRRALGEIMVRRLPAQQVGRTPVSMGLTKRESE